MLFWSFRWCWGSFQGRSWAEGHYTQPVLHMSPGRNLVLAWGSENNCKPEVGVANAEKHKLLLSAKIVEKIETRKSKNWLYTETQMGMNLWIKLAQCLLLKTTLLLQQSHQRAKGDEWCVMHAAVQNRVLHLTFKCPGRNEFPSYYGELPQPLFSGLPSGLKTHKDVCSFSLITCWSGSENMAICLRTFPIVCKTAHLRFHFLIPRHLHL